MADLRPSLVALLAVGAASFHPASGFAQDSYRLGFGMPSRWVDLSVQQFYLAPEGL